MFELLRNIAYFFNFISKTIFNILKSVKIIFQVLLYWWLIYVLYQVYKAWILDKLFDML